MKHIVVIGAYGRDYKDMFEPAKDWNAGKDFKICGGPYCSKADSQTLIDQGIGTVRIRYQRGTKSVDIALMQV